MSGLGEIQAAIEKLPEEQRMELRRSFDALGDDGVISRMRALFKKAPLTRERLDLNEAVEEVLILTQSEMQPNRISLHVELANHLPPVLGDRVQLQQVILNLIVNAIEAMSGIGECPRELWVSSRKVTKIPGQSEGDTPEDEGLAETEWTRILIAVPDSGPGLDPSSLDRLFEAFYTTRPRGLGLGLAISRSIVEAHGGRLWVKANAPRGAAFQFALPIRSEGMLYGQMNQHLTKTHRGGSDNQDDESFTWRHSAWRKARLFRQSSRHM